MPAGWRPRAGSSTASASSCGRRAVVVADVRVSGWPNADVWTVPQAARSSGFWREEGVRDGRCQVAAVGACSRDSHRTCVDPPLPSACHMPIGISA